MPYNVYLYTDTYIYTHIHIDVFTRFDVQAAIALYGQLNEDGLGMGTDRVDLHNQTVVGACKLIDDFVIPLLPALPSPFYLITGR